MTISGTPDQPTNERKDFIETDSLPDLEDIDVEDIDVIQLFNLIQDQQDVIESMEERIKNLEMQLNAVEHSQTTLSEVSEKLADGDIGGESGAQLIQEIASFPAPKSKVIARSNKLYLKIIREYQIDQPVTSQKVIDWLGLHDQTNPSQTAKRIMEKTKEHIEQGYYLGSCRLDKVNNRNAIWIEQDG